MKKYVFILCAAMVCMAALFGCGKEAPADNGAAADTGTTQTDAALTADELCGTYWTAVEYEDEGSENGAEEMPMGSWNADLILNADGTGRFRSTYGASYTSFLPECTWGYDEDTARVLVELIDGTENFAGVIDGGRLCLEYRGGSLRFEQAEMPAPGAQWCLADLGGTWKLETVEVEGYAFPAAEEGVHGSVSFFFLDPELRANYVQYDDFDNRTEVVDAMVVYLDEPIYDGCSNESWSVQLIGDDDSVRLYAALTDRDELTVLVEHYDYDYEYPSVSVQTFRWEGTGPVG